MVIHARRIKEEGREDMQTIRDHFRTCLLHQCGVVHERCGFTKEGREVGWIHWLGSMHAWWRNLSCCWCSRKVMVSGHACGCIHEVLIHQGLGSMTTCCRCCWRSCKVRAFKTCMWLHTQFLIIYKCVMCMCNLHIPLSLALLAFLLWIKIFTTSAPT